VDYPHSVECVLIHFILRPVGADANTIAAIQAGYFSGRTKASEKEFAEVASKNRKAGMKNPRIMKGEAGDYSVDDILRSRKIASSHYRAKHGYERVMVVLH
jgi:hypothetical protein